MKFMHANANADERKSYELPTTAGFIAISHAIVARRATA